MALKAYQEKILEQMGVQERMLSDLYLTFSEQFPQYGTLWKRMAMEEERHAKLIEKLHSAAKKGSIFFDEGKLKTYTLTAFITRLEEILKKAKNREFTLSDALVCAVDYETSLIEKNLFYRFDSPSDKVTRTLKILQSETLDHIQYIKKVLNEVRKSKTGE